LKEHDAIGFGIYALPSEAFIKIAAALQVADSKSDQANSLFHAAPLSPHRLSAKQKMSVSVEGVPFVPTGASPAVIPAGRPAAERASDARAGGVEVFLLIGFTINNNTGLVVREDAHASIL
jgi:hypothetical protein